jgi:hypothetical protein
MNLVQIQEHLKDMPIQAIMAYANGMNPQVPPYLALGEMQRRKQMEQRTAQVPKATVKDELEQSVQAPHQLMQSMQQQTMAPQAPTAEQMQGEEGMADGGITRLPIPDMHFGSGGIIAFAGGSKDAVKEELTDEEIEAAKKPYIGYKVDRRSATQPVTPINWFPEYAAQNAQPTNIQNTASTIAPPSEASGPIMPAAQSPVVQSRPQVAQPAAGQGLGSLPQNIAMPTNAAPGIANIALPDRAEKLAAAEERDPYLKKQPGELMEKYLERMAARDEEGRQKFKKQEEAQTRSDLWKALIEGGESTRGLTGKGIATLGTGFGKSALASAEAARQRETAQANLEREHEDNMMKINQEIENARILRANSRFDEAFKAEQKAAEIANMDRREQQKFNQEKDLAQLRFEFEKRLKNIPQAQRLSLEEQYVEEAVKKGKPKDEAIREVKTLGVGAKGVLTYDQASDNVDKWLQNNSGYISKIQSDAKKSGQPIPNAFDIRSQLINQALQQAGAASDTPPPGAVRKKG